MKHSTKLLVILVTVISTVAFAGTGWAYWTSHGTGSGTTATGTWSSDTTSPVVSVAFPADGGRYNSAGWTGTITGSASDNIALAGVTLTVRQGTGNYYNGASFASASSVPLTPTGTTNWSYALVASKLVDGQAYTVTATATDTANNTSSAVSTFTYDTTVPVRTALEMFDTNGNGKVDQVKATYSEALGAYTAANAPWTLANVPSAGTLNSVSVSGSTATLALNEGAGPATTAVGSFTVAMAANAAGIRDAAGNPAAAIGATAPADKAAPVLTALQMLDNNTNGKVDRVTATFSETLALSTDNTLWAFGGAVPSGGTKGTISTSAAVATLLITEGAGAEDTSVGTLTVALTAGAAGIRDAAGNQSSFSATAPADGAAPIILSATSGGGATAGLMQIGDTLTLTFSESLDAASVPTTTTVTEQRSGPSTLSIVNVIQTVNPISNSYLGANNSSGTATGTITRPDSKTIKITLGAVTTTGSGVGTGTGAVAMSPVVTIKDAAPAGNPAVTSLSPASVSPLF